MKFNEFEIDDNQAAQAFIEDGKIIIAIPLENLPMIVEGSWAAGAMNTRYKVTDPDEFGKELVYTLNNESENGTTMIHVMFDQAIEEAIEQGAWGIEEHEDQEF